jgi:hypothetical protein
MPNPPNNNDLQREKVRFLNQSLSLQNIIKQGSIANSSRDNVLPGVTLTLPVSLTPTPSVTISNTPTRTQNPTITPTISNTPTVTQTPTITPSISLSPTITPTVTQTNTPSITPTLTVTPSVTPTITITPSVSPDYSYIPLTTLTLDQDILVSGFPDWNYYALNSDVNFKYIINGLYRVTNYNTFNEIYNLYETTILKYQNLLGSTYVQGVSSIYSDIFKYIIFNNYVPDGIIANAPLGYGNLLQVPLCGYGKYSDWAPLSALSSIALYTNLNNFVTTSTAVSTLILRGVTGLPFDNEFSSVNGIILEWDSQTQLYHYEGLTNQASLYFESDNITLFPRNIWILDVYNTDAKNSFIYSWSGTNDPQNFGAPVWKALSEFYEDNPMLSSYAIQPNIQFLDGTGLNNFIPPITPTPTISNTPTVTPTITLTPSITSTITPTISITPTFTNTPTRTPTLTPTISITPTITPTISITPSITPTWNPNNISIVNINTLRVQIPSIGFDKYIYPNSPGSNYFNSENCGQPDNPTTDSLYFVNWQTPHKWLLGLVCAGYYYENYFSNPDYIPVDGWPVNVIFTVIN